jgi:divalent metal cation (Fe/Co/Zn/Cd) transporter
MFTLMAEHFHGHHDHGNRHGDSYGHIRGTIDPSITTSERGIWAIKWSFIGLAVTALLQLVVVLLSHSVGLLADAIHNFGDAATAIPLWIAFMLSRWKPNAKFTYGYGRVEDLAGMAIVLTIFVSAVVAGYETVQRFSHPQAVDYLWAVIAASIGEGHALAKEVRHEAMHHIEYLSNVIIHIDPMQEAGEEFHRIHAHNHDGLPVHSH